MTIRRSEAEGPASIPEPPDPPETDAALPEGSTLHAVARTTLALDAVHALLVEGVAEAAAGAGLPAAEALVEGAGGALMHSAGAILMLAEVPITFVEAVRSVYDEQARVVIERALGLPGAGPCGDPHEAGVRAAYREALGLRVFNDHAPGAQDRAFAEGLDEGRRLMRDAEGPALDKARAFARGFIGSFEGWVARDEVGQAGAMAAGRLMHDQPAAGRALRQAILESKGEGASAVYHGRASGPEFERRIREDFAFAHGVGYAQSDVGRREMERVDAMLRAARRL